jgi:beta-lactamase family protein
VARILGIALLAGAMLLGTGPANRTGHAAPPLAQASVPETSASSNASRRVVRKLVSSAAITSARRFARSRQGVVAFAVLEKRGRPRGLLRTARFPSASVSKAMLLVAFLRRFGKRGLSEAERQVLQPMIVMSDNDAASAIYAQVGGNGLRAVARAAGMRKFVDVGHWANAQITAADQARLFLRIDRLVPGLHRRYARTLLSSIVGWQRWGIPAAASRLHLKTFFKGGWRAGIVHQVALLQQKRGGRRLALAVLTSGAPSIAYGEETIERVATRILRSAGRSIERRRYSISPRRMP